MDKQDVIAYFDSQAPGWDGEMIRSDRIIGRIMDGAGVRPEIRVLDVACGTGVLFPDYLARGVRDLTAVDISPEMVRIAAEKYPQVRVICADAEETVFPDKFDLVMIYNAFPHFPEPERLIRRLAQALKPGGRLSIAHGMSRQAIQSHHAGSASRVSRDLPEAEALADMMGRYLTVETVVSDEEMYQVVGRRA